jgi:hypothetical protein
VALPSICAPTTSYVRKLSGGLGNKSPFTDESQWFSNVIQAASAVKEEALVHSKHRVLNTRHLGPHHPQHEMQFQAEDPSIIYRVADAPSRHLLREVLPLGIGPSKKGR